MRITIDWGVSPLFGWGVYGLNLALAWSGKGIEAATTEPVGSLDLDALRLKVLQPFLQRSHRARVTRRQPGEMVFTALGNDMVGATSGERLQRSKVGVIFFEQPLSTRAVDQAFEYDLIITGSTWNEQQLRSFGLENVQTIFQGVDRSLFHPAPRCGLYPDKFLIFSGGKAEPRKGQDLVVKAFRIFAKAHADAMLVKAWDSPWPQLAAGMDLDLSAVADRVIDVGALPNGRMATVYRECDVALFPNRAEGGTNLVAMEAIACGVPTILSANTGHLDLIKATGASGLHRQSPAPGQWREWGESDVEEIVEALESFYRRRHADPVPGMAPHLFQWSDTASELAAIAARFQPET